MRHLIVVILILSVALAGCSNVKVYKFKKDRVDQRNEGNRGYLLGTPPPAPVVRDVPKRTMIGVDIEIPVLPGEKVELLPEEEVRYEEETIIEMKGPAPLVGGPTVKMKEEESEEEESEEEWIK